MDLGSGLKTTTWYRCLFCTRVYPKPEQLIQHRRELHKQQWEEKMRAKQLEKLNRSEDFSEILTKPVSLNLQKEDAVPQVVTANDSTCEIFSTESILNDILNESDSKNPPEESLLGSGESVQTPHTSELLIKDSKSDEKLPCKNCHKYFRGQDNLKRHRNYYCEKRRFKCDECKRRFSQKNNLAIHKMRHNEEAPYQCFLCQKRFRTRTYLAVHEMTHTNLKPFQCDFCTLCFQTKGQKNTHCLKIHGPACVLDD